MLEESQKQSEVKPVAHITIKTNGQKKQVPVFPETMLERILLAMQGKEQ